jgi:hypothetical protein
MALIQCPWCGKEVATRIDGLLAKHKRTMRSGGHLLKPWCEGGASLTLDLPQSKRDYLRRQWRDEHGNRVVTP